MTAVLGWFGSNWKDFGTAFLLWLAIRLTLGATAFALLHFHGVGALALFLLGALAAFLMGMAQERKTINERMWSLRQFTQAGGTICRNS